MSASEIMTIVVLFHLSHYRDFKNFYLGCVTHQLHTYFPRQLSYNRFIEIQSRIFPALCMYLKTKTGEATNHYYVDSTTLSVCRNQRIARHKTFRGLAERGKSSRERFFGFKLHIVINHKGELMAVCFTTGKRDDRKVLERLLTGLQGLAAGDKGYIGKAYAEILAENGLKVITKPKKNMKSQPRSAFEKFFLSRRAIVESVIGQLKEICQIEHTRHRRPDNFFVNALSALIAYTLKPRKPAINLNSCKNISLIPNWG